MLARLCPCCPVGGEKARLVELTPFPLDGESEPPPPAGLGARFSSALKVAASPLTALRERRAEASARAERIDALKAGRVMRLVAIREPNLRSPDLDVRVQLSADGHMLTWQSLAQTNNQPQEAGVFALSAVREIRLAPNVGMFRSKPPPGQFEVACDDSMVRFETRTDAERETWMTSLEEVRSKEADAKADRKIGHQTRKKMELEKRRRAAEARKAEVLKSCGPGGMRHTAMAMLNRQAKDDGL